jgi:hypothetical protein
VAKSVKDDDQLLAEVQVPDCATIDTIDYVHGIGNTPTHSIENQRGTF